MTRPQLILLAIVAVALLAVIPLVAVPRRAAGQVATSLPGHTDTLTDIDRTLNELTGKVKELEHDLHRAGMESQAREGGIINIGHADNFRWAMNPQDGTVLRIDQRDGSVAAVFQGKPGRWTVVYTLASYCWLFSASGSVLRVDIRDGDTKVVHTTKSGIWDVSTGNRPEQIFAFATNRTTSETVRVDRRDGELKVMVPGH
jgi:uncharacterized cupin superfamily protein